MKKLIALTLSVTMILSLSACGKKEQIPSNNASNNSDNTGKTYSIDIGHGGAESTAQQVGCLALKDYLENNSNGVFTVNVYPSNSVGSDDELCQMVQNGNIAMCLANSVILNYVPDAAIYDLFMRFNNIDDVKAKYTEDENFLAVMREKYAKANFYLGGFSVHGFRQTTANKPIYSPEDLKGLTFRVMQNDLHIQGWQCMGATPTPFAFNELYTALQQGTVDAQENPIELIYSQKFYEQQKYITLTNHLQQTQQWLVNLDFYNSLSDENKAILDAGIAAATEAATNYALENEASWTKEIEDYGCTVVDLTYAQREVFREAVAPEWDAVQERVSTDVWDAYVD